MVVASYRAANIPVFARKIEAPSAVELPHISPINLLPRRHILRRRVEWRRLARLPFRFRHERIHTALPQIDPHPIARAQPRQAAPSIRFRRRIQQPTGSPPCRSACHLPSSAAPAPPPSAAHPSAAYSRSPRYPETRSARNRARRASCSRRSPAQDRLPARDNLPAPRKRPHGIQNSPHPPACSDNAAERFRLIIARLNQRRVEKISR